MHVVVYAQWLCAYFARVTHQRQANFKEIFVCFWLLANGWHLSGFVARLLTLTGLLFKACSIPRRCIAAVESEFNF